MTRRNKQRSEVTHHMKLPEVHEVVAPLWQVVNKARSRKDTKPMSSRFKLKLAGVAVAILALVAIGAGWSANAATATPIKQIPTPPTYNPRNFNITWTYVDGSPAITPRFKQCVAKTASGHAFTTADVVAYLNKDGFAPLAPGAHMKILTIQFVSAAQASKLMAGESVGRPDDALVCYVSVEGPFLVANMIHVPKGAKIPPAKYGHEVFDAHTGNMLLWGVNFS